MSPSAFSHFAIVPSVIVGDSGYKYLISHNLVSDQASTRTSV